MEAVVEGVVVVGFDVVDGVVGAGEVESWEVLGAFDVVEEGPHVFGVVVAGE